MNVLFLINNSWRGPARWKQTNNIDLKSYQMLIHVTPANSSPGGEKISPVPLDHGVVAEAGAVLTL